LVKREWGDRELRDLDGVWVASFSLVVPAASPLLRILLDLEISVYLSLPGNGYIIIIT